MTTQRLYYDDPHTIEFTAQVIENLMIDERPAIVLDQTYFYPTGGGQPNDAGEIAGVSVVDVVTRKEDGAVIHVIEAAIDADGREVLCQVDWSRRLDHMQQHTGQHILTQAFVQIADAHTVGFHLSTDTVTIDLNKPSLSDAILHEAEALANSIITENRPVTARLIDPDEAENVRMRKSIDQMQLYTDGLRVVEIADFDITACGGTHVAHTGEIGLLKITNTTKRGANTRVEFACGGRALADYGAKHTTISTLTDLLTCHYTDLPDIIQTLQDEARNQRKAIDTLTDKLIAYEVETLHASAKQIGDLSVIIAAFDERDKGELSKLASQLTEKPATITLIGTAGDKAHLICACSTDIDHNMNPLLQAAFTQLPGGRGGGRPNMAQGGGVAADRASVQAALEHAASTL